MTAEYARRRRRLMQVIGERGMAILPAARERTRNRDTHYPFRQDSDFLYLTGFPEPDAVAVLMPGRPQGEYLLFCRERNPEREQWDGLRAGPEGACARFGADDAFPIDDIDDILPGLMEGRSCIHYTLGRDAAFDQRVVGWVRRLQEQSRSGLQAPWEILSLEHHLHEMRLFKGRTELGVMRRAAAITVDGHQRGMARCRPGWREFALAAEYTHEFMRHGAVHAYPPIVGGGANACILHYIDNAAPLKKNDLVLVDAGAELDGYAADVTRTFPVGGRFSGPQREIYACVLAAQAAAIAAVRPGADWNAPHEAAVRVLSEGLLALGILQGSLDEVLAAQSYRRYYMHRTGHWLGLDVHDVGDYKVDGQWRVLEPGMVLTVEPGLYLRPAEDLDPRFWNIGVRIEDDVVVTREGCEVLTAGAVKEVAEVEAVMRS
ncbi:aminopeptidase P N-terminal domain-containing protein [Candidatus Macondimonas diazotrophica]|jgi:Xaa-Pro aminopeptidase|uniref:Xaa-Pro aminopeptidase n=1 Tax=Candidatus Macondimonas diazotrophica TaxID=2305248 RepID=A0A4Z0F864_9GAMM|nr:aminopeptidase P N-terminal domain-containing protein [Candidatus Macondimonas diazotrophica]MDY6955726.1 aminopeptidase P N-terminal domain-containing protein [Pseudomonadota bacterium]NCU00867.1 M24 family metallopeptidase [Candidatus Macondimonas diazotrophica]TFZ82539.1 M24 family metallopeptidase [Candidatus Macondimonas diazotrophica]